MCTRRHRDFTLAKDFIGLFCALVQRNARAAMSRNTA
jgi:hypothetical protein